MDTSLISKIKNIRCLICDVDGVMTDGRLYYDNHGNELKTFHVHDGVGLKLLMSVGIEVAVITTSISDLIDHRMKHLGIKHYYKGQVNKQFAYEQLQSKLDLNHEQFSYIGDDLPDLPIIQQVGLGVTVADARPQVKEHADFITENRGGEGAIRELCDMILSLQNQADRALELYLSR